MSPPSTADDTGGYGGFGVDGLSQQANANIQKPRALYPGIAPTAASTTPLTRRRARSATAISSTSP